MTTKKTEVKIIQNELEVQSKKIVDGLWGKDIKKQMSIVDDRGDKRIVHPYAYGFRQGDRIITGLTIDGIMSLVACLEQSMPDWYKPEVVSQTIEDAPRQTRNGVISGVRAIMVVKNGSTHGWGVAWESCSGKFPEQNAVTKATRNAYKKTIPLMLRQKAISMCLDEKRIEEEFKIKLDKENIGIDESQDTPKIETNRERVEDQMIKNIEKKLKKMNDRKEIVALWRQYKNTHSHSDPGTQESVLDVINIRLAALCLNEIKSI